MGTVAPLAQLALSKNVPGLKALASCCMKSARSMGFRSKDLQISEPAAVSHL